MVAGQQDREVTDLPMFCWFVPSRFFLETSMLFLPLNLAIRHPPFAHHCSLKSNAPLRGVELTHSLDSTLMAQSGVSSQTSDNALLGVGHCLS